MSNATIMTGRENFGVVWDYGFKDHQEYEIDLYWAHYFNPNLSTYLGYRLTNEMETEDRAFGGVAYRLPYMFESSLALDSKGEFRVGIGKEFQLTPRLSAHGDLEYDTNTEWGYDLGGPFLLKIGRAHG